MLEIHIGHTISVRTPNGQESARLGKILSVKVREMLLELSHSLQRVWTVKRKCDSKHAPSCRNACERQGTQRMAVWRLHQIIAVRDVFGCVCDDSKLELRGGTADPPWSWSAMCTNHRFFVRNCCQIHVLSVRNACLACIHTMAAEQSRARTTVFLIEIVARTVSSD